MSQHILRLPLSRQGSRIFTFALFVLLAHLDSPDRASAQERRPNILFVMADDHAAHAIGAYGSKVNQTPHLDQLARDGMRLDRCFATNSICTPSRATILTGKYSHLNGVPVFNTFDGSQPTVAKMLRDAGYHTGMVGKWHLGGTPTGFDRWIILPGQGAYHDPRFIEPSGQRTIKGYCTDIITDLSIEFLKSRPKDKPFFLMAHHKAPHRWWEPHPKYAREFKDKRIPEPSSLRDDYATRSSAIKANRQRVFRDLTRRDLKLVPPAELKGPARARWMGESPASVDVEIDGETRTLTGAELDAWKYQCYMRDYLACVQSVDDNVGRLLAFLDESGLRENTLVIYTSDQGFFLGDNGMYDKRLMYEPSIRMPFIVRWPGVVQPGTAEAAMATNVDFAPTFLDAARQPVPPDMQGRSLVPLLRGERPADWRTSFYYRYYDDPGAHNTAAHYGVRTETHKLIHYWKQDEWEMFDVVNDPHELRNLYSDPAHARTRDALKAELRRLKEQVKDEDQFSRQVPKADVG